jgi:hypothetical protein
VKLGKAQEKWRRKTHAYTAKSSVQKKLIAVRRWYRFRSSYNVRSVNVERAVIPKMNWGWVGVRRDAGGDYVEHPEIPSFVCVVECGITSIHVHHKLPGWFMKMLVWRGMKRI